MSRNYDNWERLVETVLDREKLRQLAREDSFDSTTSDFSSRFSFDSTLQQYVPGWRIDEHTLTVARPGSGLDVTVKSMQRGFQDNEKWLAKVNYLGQLRHPNLVKLMGYCSEAYCRFLVYECMPSGSLEMNLLGYEFMPRRHDPISRLNQILAWETRVGVAMDVARAFCFLHDRKTPVTHGHVKASIIFLDEDFNAKLDVFPDEPDPDDVKAGVLNRGDTPHPRLRSNLLLARYQYRPPEHLFPGKVTAKIDVYSFGVVLIQLLTGLRASDRPWMRQRNLVVWAEPHLSDKWKLFRIMDPKLMDQYSNEGARMLAAIALQCLSEDPELRPSMMKVLSALE